MKMIPFLFVCLITLNIYYVEAEKLVIPNYNEVVFNKDSSLYYDFENYTVLHYIDGDCPFCIVAYKNWIKLSNLFTWNDLIKVVFVIETNNKVIVENYLKNKKLSNIIVCIDSNNLYYKLNKKKLSDDQKSLLIHEGKVLEIGNVLKNKSDINKFEETMLKLFK